MASPFDPILDNIISAGYHNQRKEGHSDALVRQIVKDLDTHCEAFAIDRKAGVIREWLNEKAFDGRTTDLLIGAADDNGRPDLRNVRIIIENKSVITAHRNKNARFQDIEREMRASHANNPLTIVVATLIIGTCQRYLNVADNRKKDPRLEPGQFESDVLARLSTGDESLWLDFSKWISSNTKDDPSKTMEYFRRLPVRQMADAHEVGLDFMLFIPMAIDNVTPPSLATLDGLDPSASYWEMITHICQLYQFRWHRRQQRKP